MWASIHERPLGFGMIQSNGLATAAPASASPSMAPTGTSAVAAPGTASNYPQTGASAANGMANGSVAGGATDPYSGGSPGVGSAQMAIQGPPQVKVGDTVTVALLVQSDQPVTSVPATVSFDSTKLQFTGVTEGDFLKQGGTPTSFSSRLGQNGQLTVADAVTGGAGASAQATFAVLSFQALAPAAQTAIQVQPGAIVGAGGVPVTMAPVSPYNFGVLSK